MTKKQQSETLLQTLPDWDKNSLIVSILEKHINNSHFDADETFGNNAHGKVGRLDIQNKLANDVIKESLTNAIRHPDANLLVIGSFFDRKGKYFTIVIWDNGRSIVDSLRDGLMKYRRLRNDNSSLLASTLNPSYFIEDDKYEPEVLTAKDVDRRLYFSDTLPKLKDKDWKFLLASFYPGVTSQPVSPKKSKGEDDGQLELDFGDKIGMGLTVLLDAIIKVFGGTVKVRVDRQFISLKTIQKPYLNAIYKVKQNEIYLQPIADRYKKEGIDKSNLRKTNFTFQVKISEKHSNPLFCGNMLTLQIPLAPDA